MRNRAGERRWVVQLASTRGDAGLALPAWDCEFAPKLLQQLWMRNSDRLPPAVRDEDGTWVEPEVADVLVPNRLEWAHWGFFSSDGARQVPPSAGARLLSTEGPPGAAAVLDVRPPENAVLLFLPPDEATRSGANQAPGTHCKGRRPQKRLDRRLEEVANGGGCPSFTDRPTVRLQRYVMPLAPHCLHMPVLFPCLGVCVGGYLYPVTPFVLSPPLIRPPGGGVLHLHA